MSLSLNGYRTELRSRADHAAPSVRTPTCPGAQVALQRCPILRAGHLRLQEALDLLKPIQDYEMQTAIEKLQEQRNPRGLVIARYEGEYPTPACSSARLGELRTEPHPMPPRTTGNSCRPKVSDRTMVGTFHTTGTSLN
jgi:hypothetical protein